MKLREIYETAVRMGIESDPRGHAGVDEFLDRTKRRYERLPEHLKPLFDSESLVNPFADTRIYFGADDTEVKTILGGIDMRHDLSGACDSGSDSLANLKPHPRKQLGILTARGGDH